ncbi:hypothetical protein S83_047572, partial [Arachis hypogaea]
IQRRETFGLLGFFPTFNHCHSLILSICCISRSLILAAVIRLRQRRNLLPPPNLPSELASAVPQTITVTPEKSEAIQR